MTTKQFRSFYFNHITYDMEKLIETFSIFGGLECQIDIDAPLEELVEHKILDNFTLLHNKILELTTTEPKYTKLLIALARGDRRIFSAFNKSGMSNLFGGISLKYLQDSGVLTTEYSREKPPLKNGNRLKREIARHRISHKMRFTSPFFRFWFYFIAPMRAEIEKGNYKKVLENFKSHHQSFVGYTFEEISNEMIKLKYSSLKQTNGNSYWDRNIEIDLMSSTKSNQTIIGECKWKNHKMNKKELNKLLEKCKKIDVRADIVCLFSKRGFSNELTNLKSQQLRLFSSCDFEDLLKGVSKKDFTKGVFTL